MRIAFLCSSYLRNRGGAEQYVQRLAEEISKAGHEVTIISSEGSLIPHEQPPYRVVSLPRSRWVERVFAWIVRIEGLRGGYRLLHYLYPALEHRMLAAGPWCTGLLNKELYRNFDVVVMVHGGNAWSLLFRRMTKNLKGVLKVAIPLLHVREIQQGAEAALAKRYSDYDLIVALTDYEKEWMRSRGWRGSRLTTLGVGSDPFPLALKKGAFRQRFGISSEAPIVLFLGRKLFNKGPTHLIATMDKVWEHYPEAYLVLLGFSFNPPEWIGDAIASLRHEAKGRIINLDDVDDQTREEALEDCTLFAMPSKGDSFGIAYLDAWRHSKAVIACVDTSAESIVTEGEDGLLVPFGDIEKISRSICLMLENPVRAVEMGKAGYQKWLSRYQWADIAEKMLRIFSQKCGTNADGELRNSSSIGSVRT